MNFFRHFVPASQEWYNSIYTYNKNYPKTIPVADISLMKLFKGYFNYGIRLKYPPVYRLPLGSSPSFLAPHSAHAPHPYINKQPARAKEAFEGKKTFGAFEPFAASLQNREGATPLPMRYRLLSSKKAFLGKGDLKHTNNKVIITFYLYNANQMFISSNFNDRVKALLLPNKSLKILSQRSSPAQQAPQGPQGTQAYIYKQPADPSDPKDPKGKIILYNRMFNIYEFLASDEHYLAYYNTMGSIIKKINIVLANLNYLLAIYIYILKTNPRSGSGNPRTPQGNLFNDNYGGMQSMQSPSKILSKINSFFFIYNNLFKTNILKDNLKNNLFNIFFNFRIRKYRLLLKRKFLITNDILKIASSTLKEGCLQAAEKNNQRW